MPQFKLVSIIVEGAFHITGCETLLYSMVNNATPHSHVVRTISSDKYMTESWIGFDDASL